VVAKGLVDMERNDELGRMRKGRRKEQEGRGWHKCMGIGPIIIGERVLRECKWQVASSR
jgi:hypothetical protein